MARQIPHDRFASPGKISTVFYVGPHALRVSKVSEGRWTFAVDDREVSATFPTQAEAWEAGVRAVDQADHAAAARR
jgi:aryl-alcohol dehydrogenase-like predicted oxidoreductase